MADIDDGWRDPNFQLNDSTGLREPWERRPNESDKAWAAFVEFRDSDHRELTKIAQSSKFQCSVSNISRWCVLHNWRDRCFAYDSWRDEQERMQLARDRMAMRKRHLQLALAMQAIGAAGLRELQEKMRQKLPLNMTGDEARGMLDAGTKLERSVLGEARTSQYTKIVVNVGTSEPEPDEDVLAETVESDGGIIIKPN